jgi:hypothetical protein
MSTDEQTAQMLQVIASGDTADELADNRIIADRLGWTLEDVASCLDAAKDSKLIWGRRSGEKPAPWYCELELTVQGRRFLAAHPVTI